jgi:hypothetical protein
VGIIKEKRRGRDQSNRTVNGSNRKRKTISIKGHATVDALEGAPKVKRLSWPQCWDHRIWIKASRSNGHKKIQVTRIGCMA